MVFYWAILLGNFIFIFSWGVGSFFNFAMEKKLSETHTLITLHRIFKKYICAKVARLQREMHRLKFG